MNEENKSLDGTEHLPILSNTEFDCINWWPRQDFENKTPEEQLERLKLMFNEKPYYIYRNEAIKITEDDLIMMCLKLQKK